MNDFSINESENFLEEDAIFPTEPINFIPFERTYEFTTLITWIFCKWMHPEDNNSKEVLYTLKSKIERVLKEGEFSLELQLEFSKIESDLNRFISEPVYHNKHFLFPIPGNQFSFDYYKLMNEIWSLENRAI